MPGSFATAIASLQDLVSKGTRDVKGQKERSADRDIYQMYDDEINIHFAIVVIICHNDIDILTVGSGWIVFVFICHGQVL